MKSNHQPNTTMPAKPCPDAANPEGWRGHPRLSQADPPAPLLVLQDISSVPMEVFSTELGCCWKAGCLLGAGSAGEGSNPAQWGTPAWGCWRWAPSHRCRDIILPPRGIQSKVHELSGRSSDGEAVPESQGRDFGRAPPAQLGGGCCGGVRRGLPPKLHGAKGSTPEGTARGKQAPTCAAVPPDCGLPSSLPVLPDPARLGRAGCQNPRGAACRGVQATFSLPYSLLIFELFELYFYPSFLAE